MDTAKPVMMLLVKDYLRGVKLNNQVSDNREKATSSK